MGAGQQQNLVFTTISYTCTWTEKAYQDLTGRFATTSSHGMQYIMVLYNYYSNTILAEPIKTGVTVK